MSEDPIEFESGDDNFYRYVLNQPSIISDPSGTVGLDDAIDAGVCAVMKKVNPDVICGSAGETIGDAACRALQPFCTPKEPGENPKPEPSPEESPKNQCGV